MHFSALLRSSSYYEFLGKIYIACSSCVIKVLGVRKMFLLLFVSLATFAVCKLVVITVEWQPNSITIEHARHEISIEFHNFGWNDGYQMSSASSVFLQQQVEPWFLSCLIRNAMTGPLLFNCCGRLGCSASRCSGCSVSKILLKRHPTFPLLF